MDDLRTRFHNLPNEPRLRATLQNGDLPTLRDSLRRLLNEQKMDAVLYADVNGKILGCENADRTVSLTQFEAVAKPAIEKATQNVETVDTERIAEKLYDIVAIPVYDAEGVQFGVLALALELGDAAAQQFRNVARSEVVLLAGNQVIASTLRN